MAEANGKQVRILLSLPKYLGGPIGFPSFSSKLSLESIDDDLAAGAVELTLEKLDQWLSLEYHADGEQSSIINFG